MAELAVVRRYARALFDTANRQGQIDQVEEDLKTVDQAMRAAPRLLRALRAPTIPSARKTELVQHAFGARVSPLTQRFLTLLVERRREDVLTDIYPEFQRLANEARSLLPVQVTAALPLTDAERDALTRSLGARTGKTVVLNVNIDPSVLGGVVVRMGDTIIDGSVRSKLNQLRQRLLTGRV